MEKKDKYNVAVVGVGAVGVEMLRILKQRRFPIDKLRVFARRERDITVDGEIYHVEAIEGKSFFDIDIALFAGTEGEKGAAVTYAEKFISAGAVVIDNGADFRLKEGVPLVVPEANREEISKHKGLIANPNCTTIQMIVALAGIYKKFGLEKIILTSFQATSGAGRKAAQALCDETVRIAEKNKGKDYFEWEKRVDSLSGVFPYQIAFNVIPQIGGFKDNGYTSEEEKVVRETHKIFSDSDIKISATCVRVPVFTSHCEAIYFITKKDSFLRDIKEVVAASEGVKLFSDTTYPLPIDVEGKDEVCVGRLRFDPSARNAFWLWCVGDNLRKGAALNAVQIAEELIK